MEDMMKSFIMSMSKEDKQKMMQEFMSSLSEEERMEMVKTMMPIMMKAFNENDCKKIIKEIPPEIRGNFKKMMQGCLNALKEIEE